MYDFTSDLRYGVFARISWIKDDFHATTRIRLRFSALGGNYIRIAHQERYNMIDIYPNEPRSALYEEPGYFVSQHLCKITRALTGSCPYRIPGARTEKKRAS